MCLVTYASSFPLPSSQSHTAQNPHNPFCVADCHSELETSFGDELTGASLRGSLFTETSLCTLLSPRQGIGNIDIEQGLVMSNP
jgi:hypothetical protein